MPVGSALEAGVEYNLDLELERPSSFLRRENVY